MNLTRREVLLAAAAASLFGPVCISRSAYRRPSRVNSLSLPVVQKASVSSRLNAR